MTQLSASRFSDPSIPALPIGQIGTAVEGIVDALVSERRLVEELISLMRRQREAVARDDLQAVDESVHSVQRVLFTLGEARKRRRLLNLRLGRPEDSSLRELGEALGAHATPAFRTAREGLQHAAATLSEEVAVTRKLLREALASNDQYVRQLYGSAEAPTGYGEGIGPATTLLGGLLLNRRA